MDPTVISGKFLEYGLPGAICVILAWVAWQFRSETNECWKDRLADWKGIAETLEAVKVALKSFLSTVESRDRAQEQMIQVIAEQGKTMIDLRHELDENKKQIARLRESFIGAGIKVDGER